MNHRNPVRTEPSSPLASPAVDAAPPATEAANSSPPHEVRPSRWRRLSGFVLAPLILGGAFSFGYLPKLRSNAALAEAARARGQELLQVDTIRARMLEDPPSTALPSTVQSLNQTTLYPRAQGYVKAYFADLGDHVAAGQRLAEVDTPELDQQLAHAHGQLRHAEAGLANARARRDLAAAQLKRYQTLVAAGTSTRQELEQRTSQALADEASVAAAEADIEMQRSDLRQLRELKSFSNVVAPFAGTISARMIEPGALVAPTTPLFELVVTDPLRVFVQVPQDLAPSIHVGLKAQVTVREYPNRTFDGTVARSAGTLDPSTRTMRTELHVPNPDGALLPGMYAQATMALSVPHPVYELPATALLNDAHGTRVAVVENGHVHLRNIVIEQDRGSTIAVADGLDGDEQVVRLASASQLREGRAVQARELPGER